MTRCGRVGEAQDAAPANPDEQERAAFRRLLGKAAGATAAEVMAT
ncbi:hypothetical protein [Catenuloplanes japonicus]|nr:hypothetical protein [Catenuloplanes japonicus]